MRWNWLRPLLGKRNGADENDASTGNVVDLEGYRRRAKRRVRSLRSSWWIDVEALDISRFAESSCSHSTASAGLLPFRKQINSAR